MSLFFAQKVDVAFYRRRAERFADGYVVERDRFGDVSVMAWGGIFHGVKSQLIVIAGNLTAARERNEVLRRVSVPLVQQRQLILHHDKRPTGHGSLT